MKERSRGVKVPSFFQNKQNIYIMKNLFLKSVAIVLFCTFTVLFTYAIVKCVILYANIEL